MEITSEKPIKLKIGITLPKGLPVIFLRDTPSRCIVHDGAQSYRVRVSSAFRTPSMKQMEEWVIDSMCESVCGETIEHDGFDSHGAPSWLLALGLI